MKKLIMLFVVAILAVSSTFAENKALDTTFISMVPIESRIINNVGKIFENPKILENFRNLFLAEQEKSRGKQDKIINVFVEKNKIILSAREDDKRDIALEISYIPSVEMYEKDKLIVSLRINDAVAEVTTERAYSDENSVVMTMVVKIPENNTEEGLGAMLGAAVIPSMIYIIAQIDENKLSSLENPEDLKSFLENLSYDDLYLNK